MPNSPQKIKKNVLMFFGVLIFAVLLEIIVFNFNFVRAQVDKTVNWNVRYILEDFQPVNWSKQDGTLISDSNPQLVLYGVNQYVESISVSFRTDGEISFMNVYYANASAPIIDGSHLAQASNIDSSGTKILLNDDVSILRLDLGENANVRLYDLELIVNPAKLNFSIARMIAILVIYSLVKALFALQAPMDYGFIQEENQDKTENGTD